ncbi:MAG: hypothetical protein ABIH10_00435 [Spirochaetota bacterium]
MNKKLFSLNPLRSPSVLARLFLGSLVPLLRGTPCPLACAGFGENNFLFANLEL